MNVSEGTAPPRYPAIGSLLRLSISVILHNLAGGRKRHLTTLCRLFIFIFCCERHKSSAWSPNSSPSFEKVEHSPRFSSDDCTSENQTACPQYPTLSGMFPHFFLSSKVPFAFRGQLLDLVVRCFSPKSFAPRAGRTNGGRISGSTRRVRPAFFLFGEGQFLAPAESANLPCCRGPVRALRRVFSPVSPGLEALEALAR